MSLKVLMLSRSNLFAVPGGDTVQVSKTAESLRKMGMMVDVGLLGAPHDYSGYDLIHFFNVILPEPMSAVVSALNKPYVISTIFVDYSEYEKQHRSGLIGVLTRHMNSSSIEYAKAMLKALLAGRMPDWRFLFRGFDESVRRISTGAAMLLPNSESEMRRFKDRFEVSVPYRVIPNGVDIELFRPRDNVLRDDDLVLCVARIEGLKNQLNLIKAVKGTGLRLKIVGSPAPNHQAYYNACIEEADEYVEFIPHVDQMQLVELFAQAKVHVLPSWFETTGLVSLEAALMGCNIVVSDRGDVRDYLGDYANYCEPGSISSIRSAILTSAQADANPELPDFIRNYYSWGFAAKETLHAYRQVLQLKN